MIKNITIHNFRCFEKTRIANFGQVNLVSGRNNSGKTALLEALYLVNSPQVSSILFLKRLRRESLAFIKNLPEKSWDNFFYNQNNKQLIEIVSEDEGGSSRCLEISCDRSIEELSEYIKDLGHEKEQNVFQVDNKSMVDLQSVLTEKTHLRATLHLKWAADDKKHPVATLIAHSEGVWGKDLRTTEVKPVNFIPASVRQSSASLAQEYDKADLKNYSEKVLEAIRLVDNSIVQVKTFTIGEAAIYLKRQNQNFLPISFFGEAINKITDFVLRLINDSNSVLLIDEIENGIHYTGHRKLWQMLFRLSEQFDVQIFATTHSYEFLQAFVDVALEDNNKNHGTYIELAQNIKTNRITGIKHELETLKYEIERKMGVRGE